METKYLAGRPVLPAQPLAIPLHEAGAAPLRLPLPRPAAPSGVGGVVGVEGEDPQRVVCSLPPARLAQVPAMLPQARMPRPPDLQRRLDLLASPGLPTLLRGMPPPERHTLRDRLLDSLLDPDAGLRPVDLARHMASVVRACGGEDLAQADFEAFLQCLAEAPRVHGAQMWCALLDGLCAGLSLDASSEPACVEALVHALCRGVGLLEDPLEAEGVSRRLALAAGGPGMGPWMRTRFVDALLDAPDLPVELLGCMLLGVAVALESPAPGGTGPAPRWRVERLQEKESKGMPDRKGSPAVTAGGRAALPPTLPDLSSLLAASLELSEPQLARWGQAVGVALRSEGEDGLAGIEQALRECGGLFDAGCLVALACGLGSGLADGCPDGSAPRTLDRLEALVGQLPQAGQRMALRRGLRLAADPLGATAGWDDRIAWLQAAWRLPGVVNARTAARWFAQALALDEPAVDRLHVLETLVDHGAIHLDDAAIRQVRDLALQADPAAVPGIYGAWFESGLPCAVFDGSLAPDADWRVERRQMAQRLALVKQELQALPGLGCDSYLRMRLRGLLTGWRKDLERALALADRAGETGAPADLQVDAKAGTLAGTKAGTKASVSVVPAAR